MSGEKQVEGGVVFYPRAYHLDDANPDDHKSDYATGVDHQGQPCVIYLHPHRDALFNARNSSSGQTVPTIEEFADDRPQARFGCIARSDNAPEEPEGVLLAEQVSEAPQALVDKHPGQKVWVARWASVLTPRTRLGMPEGSKMPEPVIGQGYLEINFHPRLDADTEVMLNDWKAQEKAAGGYPNADPDTRAQLDELADRIYEARRKWFVATVIQSEATQTLDRPSASALRAMCQAPMEANTTEGMYGGALLRVRRGNIVDSTLSARVAMQYDYRNQRVMGFDEVWENFMKYHGGRMLSRMQNDTSLALDVIPVQRINCGKPGNERYSQGLTHDGKLMKTYVEKHLRNDPTCNFVRDNAFLFAKIAIRLAEVRRGAGRGNKLVSAIHAWSAPQGNALTIAGPDGAGYQMDFAEASARTPDADSGDSAGPGATRERPSPGF